jgi:uncharacterized protein with HEPN domain
MSVSNLELLRHIEEEIGFILQHTAGKSKGEVFADAVLSRAIVRSLEIIGEASRKIDTAFKEKHPQIEWRKMAGTRDRLIHDYFGVDNDIVWDIIETKLPQLQKDVSAILQSE